VSSFLAIKGNLFASTAKGMFVSTNNGTNWAAVTMGLPVDVTFPLRATVNTLALAGTNLFAGTNGHGIYLSTDTGANWSAINSGLTDTCILSLLVNGAKIFAGTSSGIFLSSDNGTSWTAVNSGLPPNSMVKTLTAFGTNLFAGTANGVYRSSDNGNNWLAVNVGMTNSSTYSLSYFKSTLVAGTNNDVSLSNNNGLNWTTGSSFPGNTSVVAFAMNETYIFAGTKGWGMYSSSDNGATWIPIDSGLPLTTYISSLALSGPNLFAGTGNANLAGHQTGGIGIYFSSNNGINWTPVNTGLLDYNIISLAAKGVNVFAGTYSGIYRSTDNGSNWSKADSGLTDLVISALTTFGPNIIAGTYGGIFLSPNNGANWSIVNQTGAVRAFTASGTNLVAASSSGDILLSKDSGETWSEVNFGMPANVWISTLATNDTIVFAGTEGNSVWRRPLSEMTGVINQRSQQRTSNFIIRSSSHTNPNATIEFSLPHSDQVIVEIYNLSGRKITTLVNRNFGPGAHIITWNSKYSGTGCYLVKMKAGSNTYVKSIPFFR
jgi:photosystem II stability/assembly factor-like uncharacterized protein